MDNRSSQDDGCFAILNVVSNRTRLALNTCDITYIESKGRKAHIYLANEPSPVVTYEKLGDLLMRLPSSVVRCHGSFLVNLARVREVTKAECKLFDGTLVPVSRACFQNVLHAFRYDKGTGHLSHFVD